MVVARLSVGEWNIFTPKFQWTFLTFLVWSIIVRHILPILWWISLKSKERECIWSLSVSQSPFHSSIVDVNKTTFETKIHLRQKYKDLCTNISCNDDGKDSILSVIFLYFRSSLPLCGDADQDDNSRHEHRQNELLPWNTWSKHLFCWWYLLLQKHIL